MTLQLVLLAVMGFVLFNVSTALLSTKSQAQRAIHGAEETNLVDAASETLVQAVRMAKLQYFLKTMNCTKAVGFEESIIKGHQCSEVSDLSIFRREDWENANSLGSELNYKQSLRIKFDGSTWNPEQPFMTTQISRLEINYYFLGAIPDSERLNFSIVINGSNRVVKKNVWIQSGNNQLVQTDSADGLLKSARKDTSFPCKADQWGSLQKVVGSQCLSLGDVGAGRGVAIVDGEYYLLSQGTGQVWRITGTNERELIPVQGRGRFPKYNQEALQGTYDITVLGEFTEEPEVYYTFGTGMGSQLGYLDPNTGERVPVCSLGELNYGLGFSGLSRAFVSDSLFSGKSFSKMRWAQFYLKSQASGKLFELIVVSVPEGTLALPAHKKIGQRDVYCHLKPREDMEYEFKRTMGFELKDTYLRYGFY